MKKFLIVAVLLMGIGVAFFAAWKSVRSYYFDDFKLQALNFQPNADGSISVTLLLTNGTSVPLNVHDDTYGNPMIYIEPEGGKRTLLTDIGNQLKINLAPGSCLTNLITLTNPPRRFRLASSLRDLDAEAKVWRAYRFLPNSWAKQTVEWRRKEWDLPLRYTDWIELKNSTNASAEVP